MTPSRQRDVRHLTLRIVRNGSVAAHAHGTHQLLRVDRGALAFTHRNASWVVPTGGAVWLPAGLVHQLTALDDADLAALYVRPRDGDHFAGAGPVEMSPLLDVLMRTLARPVHDPARRAHLEAVVRDELADLRPRPFVVATPLDTAARRVALELVADPSDDRTLGELAATVGTSARTLQRRFKTETGLSFQTWRRRAGLQRAMTLLSDGHNVTETAHRCGFTSASAFIAAFRAEVGVTPAMWQRNGAGDHARSGLAPVRPSSSALV